MYRYHTVEAECDVSHREKRPTRNYNYGYYCKIDLIHITHWTHLQTWVEVLAATRSSCWFVCVSACLLGRQRILAFVSYRRTVTIKMTPYPPACCCRFSSFGLSWLQVELTSVNAKPHVVALADSSLCRTMAFPEHRHAAKRAQRSLFGVSAVSAAPMPHLQFHLFHLPQF